MNTLEIFLLASGLLIPLLFVPSLGGLLPQCGATFVILLRYWVVFIAFVLLLRLVAGVFLLATGAELHGISWFYPIRIAYPNYGVLHGLPYIAACIVLLKWFVPIVEFIGASAWKHSLLWGFAVVVLLCFGGIHGGFVAGNLGVAASSDHLADASLNSGISEVFGTHTARISRLSGPAYQAPHSISHPAGSVAYWTALSGRVGPLVFSVVNVLIFSLAFPVIFWALRRRFDAEVAILGAVACMMVPALLIYGRSDDAVYYALAAIAAALTLSAIREASHSLAVLSGCVLALAMNFSYAALVLLPAVVAFSGDVRLRHAWTYALRLPPYLAIVSVIIGVALAWEWWAASYNWLEAFAASVRHNQGTNIVAMIAQGKYARILNDRIMVICDFFIFGGPLLLYLFVNLIRDRAKRVGDWELKNLALAVLLIVLAVNSNGPGEVSRPWGSLFVLIAFFWFPQLLKREGAQSRWCLVRVQLGWALLLQVPLDFGW